jgi:predicted acetyltransferase
MASRELCIRNSQWLGINCQGLLARPSMLHCYRAPFTEPTTQIYAESRSIRVMILLWTECDSILLTKILECSLDPFGSFTSMTCPSFWEQDPNLMANFDLGGYLIYAEQELLGFAMLLGIEKPPVVIGDFFILRTFRRSGIGSNAAKLVMQTQMGPWEIPFQTDNSGAARFWRRVAESLAPGRWSEELRAVPNKPEIPPDAWISLPSSGPNHPE